MTREFDVGDILSITDGRLLSLRHIDGIYDILNYMTGDNLFTHQLPRASKVCQPFLLKQHPDLADAGEIPDFVSGDKEGNQKLLEEWLKKFGPPRPVEPIPNEAWTHINPIEEACDIVGSEKIWVV